MNEKIILVIIIILILIVIMITAFAQVSFVVRVEAGGIRASVMAWWQSRHRKTAYERRQQRLRAEARTASRLLRAFQEDHRGGQLSKLGMALQAVDVPVPQETKATETACAEPAPAVTRKRRTGKRVAPTPAVSCAAPAPLIEYAASEPAVTDTAPTPARKNVAPAPAVTSAIRPPAPAPAVTSAIRPPALVTKYASTCPVASSPADLSEAAAYVAAARASEEALLAELLKTETNFADLAAQSLLIEEAQQAAQAKKKPKTKR